ncbi:MAG: isocitrate lyase/phosphoenolpyruvate mutase family protein [Pseudomonadota bacterium]
MPSQAEKAEIFKALHEQETAFILPNPWDVGGAQMLTGLGAKALATTSAGHAFTLGKFDSSGGVTREEAIAHAADIVHATPLPVSADLENGYGDSPDAVAETVRAAIAVGLAGCSIEDSTMNREAPSYDFESAVARIKAGVDVARSAGFPFQFCARADGVMIGAYDVNEAIRRLRAFEEVGADVLYAPLLPDLDALKTVTSSVSKPVNALAYGKLAEASLDELSNAGAKRVSIGGGLFNAAQEAFFNAASAMFAEGDFSTLAGLSAGRSIHKARKAGIATLEG